MSRMPMADLVTIGQHWRRRRDHQLAQIRQIHRADRLAELELLEPPPDSRRVLLIGFTELRTRWQVHTTAD